MSVLHQAIKTRSVATDHVSTVRLEPIGPRTRIARDFDPGPVTVFVDNRLENATTPPGDHTVFGVAQDDLVLMIGFHTESEGSRQVTIYRDGGSLETTRGVPTRFGEKSMHFFAVIGDDLLTDAMRTSAKKFYKLSTPQVRYLFRNNLAALNTISPHYARLIAASKIRRSASRSLKRRQTR